MIHITLFVVQEFKGDKFSKPREFGVSRGVIYFDSLPRIGTQYPLKGLKRVKYSFYTIPSIIPGKIKMEDVIVDAGCRFHLRSFCVSSNYIVLIANIGYADVSGLRHQNWILIMNCKTNQDVRGSWFY